MVVHESSRNESAFAATLDQPLYVNDVLVVPKGADVYGQLEEAKEAGRLAGKAQLKLSLSGVVVNGQTYALSTGNYELSGKSRTANTATKCWAFSVTRELVHPIPSVTKVTNASPGSCTTLRKQGT